MRAELPAPAWLGAAGACGCLLLFAARRGSWLAIPGAVLIGFAWAGAWAGLRLADELPSANEGRDAEIVGVVAGLPQRFENGVRFDFDVGRAPFAVPAQISLAWYRGWRPQEDDEFHPLPTIRAGERWQLTVRLKRPHGNANPGVFDYESWLLERNIGATGYIRPNPPERLADMVWQAGYGIERLRLAVRDSFAGILPEAEYPYAGVLVALAVGDQKAIEVESQN